MKRQEKGAWFVNRFLGQEAKKNRHDDVCCPKMNYKNQKPANMWYKSAISVGYKRCYAIIINKNFIILLTLILFP